MLKKIFNNKTFSKKQ